MPQHICKEMDCGSIVSEPYSGSRVFSTERSQSMTVLGQPRMTHLESLEAKMANIEVSLSTSTNTPRRRKGISLGGANTTSSRTSTYSVDNVGVHSIVKQEPISALQDREAIMQNFRGQLGFRKLQRATATSSDETYVTEKELQRLKNDADNKRVTIRNLKTALDNLDITDNIDVRIRQAELEYALGREELHLLSLVEEIRALQSHLDKSLKTGSMRKQVSLYVQLHSGLNMSLCAVNANSSCFGFSSEDNGSGVYVDWVLDGEPIFRGDRIIECNGKFINSQSREDIRKLINSNGKCELVVIRKRTSEQNHQMLLQSQEDNQRLQHRISYLEDQVKELQQSTKDMITVPAQNKKTKQPPKVMKGDHVTSISISSSSPHENEKPQIYQRGNFVATIVGGKALQTSSNQTSTIATDALKASSNSLNFAKIAEEKLNGYPKSDSEHDLNSHSQRTVSQYSHIQQQFVSKNKLFETATKISIRSNCNNSQYFLKKKDRNGDHFKENQRTRGHSDSHNSHPDLLFEGVIKPENYFISKQTQDQSGAHSGNSRYKKGCEIRSAKSLDFEEDAKLNMLSIPKPQTASTFHRKQSEDDYTSEPATPKSTNTLRLRSGRPTPPKKPLRLSLQRTQSLQTIEANAAATIIDLERKRAIKRTHRGNKTPDLHQYIDDRIS